MYRYECLGLSLPHLSSQTSKHTLRYVGPSRLQKLDIEFPRLQMKETFVAATSCDAMCCWSLNMYHTRLAYNENYFLVDALSAAHGHCKMGSLVMRLMSALLS